MGQIQRQSPPPTYTSTQIEKIQSYIPGILDNHQRLTDLQANIQAENWPEVQAIMRGPLGQMLQDMRNLSRNLLPQDQQAANQITRDLFEDLTAIDQAGQLDKVKQALSRYEDVVQDFERFMDLLPVDQPA